MLTHFFPPFQHLLSERRQSLGQQMLELGCENATVGENGLMGKGSTYWNGKYFVMGLYIAMGVLCIPLFYKNYIYKLYNKFHINYTFIYKLLYFFYFNYII